MFEFFSCDAKRVVMHARGEARRRGQDAVGVGHLVYGLAQDGEVYSAGMLRTLGVDCSEVRRRLETHLGGPPDPAAGQSPRVTYDPSFIPDACVVLERAEREAVQTSRAGVAYDTVYSGHILLAVLLGPTSPATQVLFNLGVHADDVRRLLPAPWEYWSTDLNAWTDALLQQVAVSLTAPTDDLCRASAPFVTREKRRATLRHEKEIAALPEPWKSRAVDLQTQSDELERRQDRALEAMDEDRIRRLRARRLAISRQLDVLLMAAEYAEIVGRLPETPRTSANALLTRLITVEARRCEAQDVENFAWAAVLREEAHHLRSRLDNLVTLRDRASDETPEELRIARLPEPWRSQAAELRSEIGDLQRRQDCALDAGDQAHFDEFGARRGKLRQELDLVLMSADYLQAIAGLPEAARPAANDLLARMIEMEWRKCELILGHEFERAAALRDEVRLARHRLDGMLAPGVPAKRS